MSNKRANERAVGRLARPGKDLDGNGDGATGGDGSDENRSDDEQQGDDDAGEE